MTYTSSSAFFAALGAAPITTEDYGTLNAGQIINPGSVIDGITYVSFDLGGHGTQGLVSNQFNSFTGKSLGANEDGGAAQFFFDGDSFVINFAPTYAIGVFFNVNANSGTFSVLTPVGNADTGSASYDTSTFVFDGLISTTPFTTATIIGSSGGAGTASFNIPEIVLAPSAPEPGTWLMGTGGLLLLWLRRRA